MSILMVPNLSEPYSIFIDIISLKRSCLGYPIYIYIFFSK